MTSQSFRCSTVLCNFEIACLHKTTELSLNQSTINPRLQLCTALYFCFCFCFVCFYYVFQASQGFNMTGSFSDTIWKHLRGRKISCYLAKINAF